MIPQMTREDANMGFGEERCATVAHGRAMISQPMRGVADDDVEAVRSAASARLSAMGYSVVDTLFRDDYNDAVAKGVKNVGIAMLARSISAMSKCDAALFCCGWELARGCRIEYEVARSYGLDLLFEDDIDGAECGDGK